MKIKQVIDALESFAPLPLQESYDNAGLQIGLTKAEVSGALLCLDVTEDVIDEAVRLDCNLIIAHHPILFKGLKCIADNTQVERCVRMAIKNDICIYASHTNMDTVTDGVNFKMAEKLGLVDVQLIEAHDVQTNNGKVKAGLGVIGYLPMSEEAEQFLQRVKQTFGCECLMHNELLARDIQCVAICGGAAGFVVDKAIECEADAFVTGEMHYHEYFGKEQTIQIAVTGHYESEHFTAEIFRDIIYDKCPDLPVYIAETNTNPINYLI